MIRKVLGAAFLAAVIVAPLSASAQGVPRGVDRGAREGERAAGPVGAVVGGTIGGVVGGVSGLLGVDQRPRFHSYVIEQHRPSYRYQGDLRVGAELPEAGVTYYDVPQEYGVREYRYTVVNDRTVLVDPHTGRSPYTSHRGNRGLDHKKNAGEAAQVERLFLVRDRIIPVLSA